MLALFILVFGMCSRLIWHTPNFTPLLALALFSGVYVNKKYAVILPFTLIVLSDIFLGLHGVIFYTWGSIALIAYLGYRIREKKSFPILFGSSIASAVLFFLITNFGVWLTDLYPDTVKGFIHCYTLAIPFFRSTLIATLGYSALFFGGYAYIAKRVRNTSLARALLTTS